MSYSYIKETVAKSGKSLPCSAVNDKGENVIISGDSNCYVTHTMQKNDWCRVNEYYPDGTITETFER